ncbi:uncharacterized protein G6M90_00g103860 [Metarhizium brunneum]|uniref:Uncharacterized protein n=1 Tax=Metarhizium brunneum TaxID=500148 RepID=A0A7D5V2T9_9HYPO|nr:hypothetical protein G6M90_00g103860 [Metarhizium brunneum]
MHGRQPGTILEEPGDHLRGRQLAVIDVERRLNAQSPKALQLYWSKMGSPGAGQHVHDIRTTHGNSAAIPIFPAGQEAIAAIARALSWTVRIIAPLDTKGHSGNRLAKASHHSVLQAPRTAAASW